MIEFKHVSRYYSHKLAVDDLCLTIPPGEVFALLGPNGAGKTTSIKLLVGLLRPDLGAINVCGYDLTTQLREASRCLGYVPDEPFLYDKLSGREFLEFSAQMRGMDRRSIDECIARESENFSLGGYIDDLIETYSHGMKQRMVFASALLHKPPVVVIDEPMVGLDPRSIRAVKDLLHTLAGRGTTVLMSTHILAIAEEIAHRIGILHKGKLRFLGTVAEIENDPTFCSEISAIRTKASEGNGHPNGGSSSKNGGGNGSLLESFFLHLTEEQDESGYVASDLSKSLK